DEGMASGDLRAFVRANLPEPPARVLEVGAGDGRLGRALRAVGYDVVAIDPLHHVDPLDESCRRLGELVEPGGTLVVDEFDVETFDIAAAEWWLEQRRLLGDSVPKTAAELVEEHREHLHPLARVVTALEPHFELGPPLRGPWLYRWSLVEPLRAVEEEAIVRGELHATGARLVGRRRV